MAADHSTRRLAFSLLGALLAAPVLGAATYLVSPSGNDSSAGSAAAPWRTLAHAAATAVAGDTVEVAAGTYAEQVVFTRSGTAAAPIVFRARAGDTPVIDGSTLTAGSGWSPLLWVNGAGHVTLQGFELTGLRSTVKNHVPIGILVNGAAAGVRLLDNHVHDMGTSYTGKNGGDAHGIAVYGDSTTPVDGIVIRGNRLENLLLGSSESLVVNGNVTGFLVESNVVHDCNNIGIDAIGHEGTCPDPAQDAARSGIIRLNTVYNISSHGNPAYGNDYSADGLYVDGGRDILIERNTGHDCDIGVELASEHAGQSTAGIKVRDNLVYHNRIGGLFMGGYDTLRGSTRTCDIEHNTFFENDTRQDGNGEIYLQFDVSDSVISRNIIVTGAQNLVVGNPFTQNTGNTLDYNVVSSPGKPRWQWKKTGYADWSAWRAGSSQDTHSVNADPLLLDPANGNFSLRPKSPAIDAGDPAFVPAAGETDYDGRPRVLGPRTDIGAMEFDLMAFATAGKAEPTKLALTGGEAHLTFRRRTDWAAQSLEFQVETTTTLAPAAWAPASPVSTLAVVPVSPADGTERVTFALTPPGSSRWFVRVQVGVIP